jgi:hypothetical protein
MTPTTKPFWQSKTVWVQVLAVLSMLIPAVGAWVASNPVEFVAVLAAVNTVVRFATSGKVSIFQDDSANDSGGKSGGGSGGSWLLAMMATAAGGLSMAGALLLSSCVVGVDDAGNYSLRPDPNTVDVALKYLIRHEDDDAKSGMTRWTYHDPATGELIPEEDYAAWGIKP